MVDYWYKLTHGPLPILSVKDLDIQREKQLSQLRKQKRGEEMSFIASIVPFIVCCAVVLLWTVFFAICYVALSYIALSSSHTRTRSLSPSLPLSHSLSLSLSLSHTHTHIIQSIANQIKALTPIQTSTPPRTLTQSTTRTDKAYLHPDLTWIWSVILIVRAMMQNGGLIKNI